MQGRGWITWEEAGGILGGQNGDLAMRAKFLDHLAIRSGYTQEVRAGGSGNRRGKRDMSAGDLLEIQLER
jgi:hypothetical protein